MPDGAELSVRLPGKLIEAFDLHDPTQWPGLRVVEIRPHGKGFSIFISGTVEALTQLRCECDALSRYSLDGENFERVQAYGWACVDAKQRIDRAVRFMKK